MTGLEIGRGKSEEEKRGQKNNKPAARRKRGKGDEKECVALEIQESNPNKLPIG